LQVETERSRHDQSAEHDTALRSANRKWQLAEERLDAFKIDLAKEHAREIAQLMSDFGQERQSIFSEHEQVLAMTKEALEAKADNRLKEEHQKVAKQLHDTETELRSLREAQAHALSGGGTQDNLFQCLIPVKPQMADGGEQKSSPHTIGCDKRRPIPLSEIEKMAVDQADDCGSELSNVSAFIRALPDLELPSVLEQTRSLDTAGEIASQESPKAPNLASKRKHDAISDRGVYVGDGQSMSGQQGHESPPTDDMNDRISIYARPEQWPSPRPSRTQLRFAAHMGGPPSRQLSNRSEATAETSERPAKLVRTPLAGLIPLPAQRRGNRQSIPPKATAVAGSLRRDSGKKVASTRKSRRIENMESLRAKFEDDNGPDVQSKA
jgi:hypothetical protein